MSLAVVACLLLVGCGSGSTPEASAPPADFQSRISEVEKNTSLNPEQKRKIIEDLRQREAETKSR